MLEAADPYQELSEGEAIGVIDRFVLQHRLPNGKTMLDQFLAGRPDLTAADREILRGWRATRWRGSSRSTIRTGTRSSC